jgi:two-component system nitrate/nitrite response regulator NarL
MAVSRQKIRILLADDHAIFRRGLKNMLNDERDFHVVGEAANGDEALKLVEQLHPDLILLDLNMPVTSGIDVLRFLAESRSKVRTIVLSVEPKEEEILIALKLGTRGFVLKDSASTTLFDSIRAVMTGQYWMYSKSASSPDQILKQFGDSANLTKPKKFGLTDREIEIVKAVVSGHPNKEIASLLSISEHTVKHHITSIFDKLGVYNRLELALFVYHHNIILE